MRSEGDEPLIKHRTFDPQTRTLKKHTNDDDVQMEDADADDGIPASQYVLTDDTTLEASKVLFPFVSSSTETPHRAMIQRFFLNLMRDVGEKAGTGTSNITNTG